MRWKKWLAALCCLGAMACPTVQAQEERVTFFVSDLHLGLGRNADGAWHPFEDFRWSGALSGFLDAIGKEGADRVDLVVLGDFMEFWQLPQDMDCQGSGAGAGCTAPALATLAQRIVDAHANDFALLRAFSQRGANRLHIVPGNHDAALLLPQVWAPVAQALGASSGRAVLVAEGVWRSADGRVVAEHGQQIGSDVNRFDAWPQVTTTDTQGHVRMIRPWGERFVQQLFNEQERQYPIIDNLSPETAGARYRMADRGVWGSAADMARFIAFNIFETSADQKAAVLSAPVVGGAPPPDAPFDRKAALAAGVQLFTLSLTADDPMRKMLEGQEPQAVAVRRELQAVAETLSDAELQMLCRNAVVYTKGDPCRPTLSAIAHGALVPRQAVFSEHLGARRRSLGPFDIFVFGHTHQWEKGWELATAGQRPVGVFNTGAFQRLIDEEGFLTRARARGWSPSEALRRLQPEDLPPCYGVVAVRHPGGIPIAELRLWQMPEGGSGRFRQPGVSDCR